MLRNEASVSSVADASFLSMTRLFRVVVTKSIFTPIGFRAPGFSDSNPNPFPKD